MQASLASFQDLQYCKTDLIATKGVVFCKYAKSSSALAALEAITDTGMVSSGRTCVCCILDALVNDPQAHSCICTVSTTVHTARHPTVWNGNMNVSFELMGAVHC